jgi:hypothetical protein
VLKHRVVSPFRDLVSDRTIEKDAQIPDHILADKAALTRLSEAGCVVAIEEDEIYSAPAGLAEAAMPQREAEPAAQPTEQQTEEDADHEQKAPVKPTKSSSKSKSY